ncbi:MAG: hypothetical protein Q4G43_07785 [Mobilicoccus sp.]|nr:hypothetical protein [Mobilicoccus sp.]
MPDLPASVRLALWVPYAWAGGATLVSAVAAATPDLEVDADAALTRLAVWGEVGERTLRVSLPVPGDLVGLPRGDGAFLTDVLDVGECVWSPLVGGALVPEFATYGPPGDEGELVRWHDHACAPPSSPAPSEDERDLAALLARATRELEDLDVVPWQEGLRDLAEARLRAGTWGLPPTLPGTAVRDIVRAAIVEAIARDGLQGHSVDRYADQRREVILRELAGRARRALAAATDAGAAAIAAQGGPAVRT